MRKLNKILGTLLVGSAVLSVSAFSSHAYTWHNEGGRRTFTDDHGVKAINTWEATYTVKNGVTSPATWYHFDKTGTMNTGWFQDVDSMWYYLDPSTGEMKTGWVSVNGSSYYLQSNGQLLVNGITPDGYRVNSNGIWDGSPKTNQPATNPQDSSSYAQRVVDLVNQYRQSKGLSTLTVDNTLSQIAAKRAEHITTNFSHSVPSVAHTASDPNGLGTFLENNGYHWLSYGENLAYNQPTPEAVMNSWLNSPTHKANIENPNVTQIGIGYVKNSNGVYWTQLFGSR